jgi:glycosyltransferase involved in cell wall biosynthesis
MDRMAADPEMRARMGAAALERSRTRFSLDAITAQWVELLNGPASSQ